MRLPVLNGLKAAREMVTTFRGLNRMPQAGPGEWADMRNLTGTQFPTLAPRVPRGMVRKLTKPNGIFARDALGWVDGEELYYGGELVGRVEDGPKRFVAMGAYVLVWPDKLQYNTATGVMESLEAETTTEGTVTYTLCRDDGSAYEAYETGGTPPDSPDDGQLWVDTRDTPHVLKQWSSMRGLWVSMPTTFVKISAEGIGAGFAAHDGVTITGCEIETLNGDVLLYGADADSVIVTGVIDQTGTQETPVTIRRTVPDMDYITEFGNRVWGCSSKNHEIYACKLGDPKNWRCYAGLSTDSYAATIGTPGDFTGAATHMGYVLFFKEDVIHKVYGFKPSNFEITEVKARGVQKGSEKSLAVVNETLYYKAAASVCAYGTALPQGISMALGTETGADAVAGTAGELYYISMRGKDGWEMLVWDERRGLWHREDDTEAMGFARVNGTLYCLRADGVLFTMDGTIGPYGDEEFAHVEGEAEGSYAGGRSATKRRQPPPEWMAETGDIGISSPDRKYVSKVTLRLTVGENALVRVWVQYDGGSWRNVDRMNPWGQRSVLVPIRPRRCDVMRIRLEGYGDFRLHALTKSVEGGSEL